MSALFNMQEEVSKLEYAISLATVGHGNQLRRGNLELYINHPLRVMGTLRRSGDHDEATLIAAVCHDLLEDTHITAEQIFNYFGQEVLDIVKRLTREKGVSRTTYILSLVEGTCVKSLAIKFHDAHDNSIPRTGYNDAGDVFMVNVGRYEEYKRLIGKRLHELGYHLHATLEVEHANQC